MERKVSIIVPVHNAENYLAACLGNLVNQTLQQIEIIIIDDNSSDRSLQIMKDCKEQFGDKIVILQSDAPAGAGGARNLGIQEARGEYIGFVDSDDIADVTMFEKLYHKALEKKYDVVDTGFYDEKNDQGIIFTSDELTGILMNEQRKELIAGGGYIWSKIFKTDYISKHKLKFRENVILEDADFLTYVFATAEAIGNVKELLYKYSDVKGSASKILEPNGYLHNIKNAIHAIYSKVGSLPNYSEIFEGVEYEILQMYLNGIVISLMNREMVDFDAKRELQGLRKLKLGITAGGYENPYVLNKMEERDIELMRKNDRSVEELLRDFSS